MSAFSDRLNKLDPEELIEKVRAQRDAEYEEYCKENGIEPRRVPTSCQRCDSPRIASVCADGKDYSNLTIENEEVDGYLPANIGIGSGGGEIDFSYCLECGQMQGEFPISKENAQRALREMCGEYEEDEEED